MVLVDDRDVDELRSRLGRAPRVAIDTEFHAERRYLPKLYLLQLHLDDGSTWIVDPLIPRLLERLAPELVRLTWVVHGGAQDLRILHPLLGGLPERVLDTQIAAGLVGDRYPAAYAQLLETWLGQHVDKGETLSDWSKRPLSADQLRYAAEDVASLLPLWDALAARAEQRGRTALVEAACAEARAEIVDPPALDTLWRGIPAASVLNRQQAAVLQELAAWREQTARETDQPPPTVIGTGILVDLARRQPLTLESLGANRRLPKGVVKRHGPALLEAIGRAAARPSWGWPDPIPDASPRARQVTLLRCLLQSAGAREGWAANAVVPDALLEDLVSLPETTAEAIALRLGTWRGALCSELLWEGLRGEVALRLVDGDVSIQRIGARDIGSV